MVIHYFWLWVTCNRNPLYFSSNGHRSVHSHASVPSYWPIPYLDEEWVQSYVDPLFFSYELDTFSPTSSLNSIWAIPRFFFIRDRGSVFYAYFLASHKCRNGASLERELRIWPANPSVPQINWQDMLKNKSKGKWYSRSNASLSHPHGLVDQHAPRALLRSNVRSHSTQNKKVHIKPLFGACDFVPFLLYRLNPTSSHYLQASLWMGRHSRQSHTSRSDSRRQRRKSNPLHRACFSQREHYPG